MSRQERNPFTRLEPALGILPQYHFTYLPVGQVAGEHFGGRLQLIMGF